jgi:hypothetical protein
MTTFRTIYNAATETLQIDHPSAVVTSVANSANSPGDNPAQSALGQCFPNPTSSTITIEYAVAKAGHVTIALYSMLGKEIGKVVDKHHEPGTFRANHDVAGFAQGIYLYRMVTGAFSQTRKFTVAQ